MKFKRKPIQKKSWFSSHWFFGVLALLLLLITSSLVKEFYRSHQINKEITQLQDEIRQLEGKNQEFSEFVEFLKTDVYLEEQARIKLGMKAPGEKVIVLKDDPSLIQDGSIQEQVGDFARVNELTESNTKKWWNYFWSATTS